jgi:molecular chaperone GrpE (heat shock protein)
MTSFDEWMSTIGIDAFRHANCCKIAYEAGQQSRQAEISELQKQIDELKNQLKDLQSFENTRNEVEKKSKAVLV